MAARLRHPADSGTGLQGRKTWLSPLPWLPKPLLDPLLSLEHRGTARAPEADPNGRFRTPHPERPWLAQARDAWPSALENPRSTSNRGTRQNTRRNEASALLDS